MYHVKLDCFSFYTREEAKAFEAALLAAFCQMKESEGIAAISRIDFEKVDLEEAEMD